MRVDCDVNDLLSDSSFRNWVLHGDAESGSFWENWLLQHPGKKETVAQARIILSSLQFHESDLSEKEKQHLLNRIKASNATQHQDQSISRGAVVRPISSRVEQLQHQQNSRKSAKRRIMAYAAILVGALIFALSVHLLTGNPKHAAEILYVEKMNNKGQKATIFLPDGSRVMLNSSSTIRYPKGFAAETRDVYLKGEAFFEVTKSSKAFIVHTDKLDARVLGTSFNVNAYPDTKEHSVSLVTGKVKVHPSKDEQQYLVLGPGEKGKVDGAAAAPVKTRFDYEEEILWKEGILFFKDLPIEEAFRRMEQWYGVEFVSGSLPREGYHVTGRFDNESLENVLKSIGFTIKFNYKIEGNKIYLSFHK